MTVAELKGLVDKYELWNEPDTNYGGYQMIQPQDYIQMATQVIPEIKRIDPDADVVILSTCGFLTEEDKAYTEEILCSGVPALADAISLHTVNVDAMPQNRDEYYYHYDAMMNEMRDMAEAHGFTGYLIADELNYRSFYSFTVLQPEEPYSYYPTETEVAAKNIARMMVINRGMGIRVGTSGTNAYERVLEGRILRDYNRMMNGLTPVKLDLRIDSSIKEFRHYAFSAPNGDIYLAAWKDTAATADDQSIACDLTIGGMNAKRADWLDPFYARTKSLHFENTSEGINIGGLYLTDYPIFIQIGKGL